MAIIHSSTKFEIKRLYELHGSVRTVANLMSLDRKVVTDVLVSMNVEIKTNQGGAKKKLEEWQERAVIKKFKNKVFSKWTDGVDYIFSSFKIRVSFSYIRALLKKK